MGLERLEMPAYLLEAIAAHCRTQYPREACGFLCGSKGSRRPERFVPIPNVHPEPESFFRMSDQAVVNAFRVMDELGEDPLGVYHSHVSTSAMLSATDLGSIHDFDAVHIVCSLAQSPTQPTFRAWKVREHEGSSRVADEVAMEIIDVTHPDSPVQGLAEGNRVRMTYNSDSGAQRKIVGVVGQHQGESVVMYPDRPADGVRRVVVALDRIVSVAILVEGTSAARTRATAASFLAEAAMRLAATDTDGARGALERAAGLMPRLMPRLPHAPRGWRPVRASEKRVMDRYNEEIEEQDPGE